MTERRKAELEELARLRKQRLLDALSLYKLFSDADVIEAWIDEKVRLESKEGFYKHMLQLEKQVVYILGQTADDIGTN